MAKGDETLRELVVSPEGRVEVKEQEKRVAKDGTKRGMGRKGSKNRVTVLIEQIQKAVERHTGIKNWDPVVQMSVVAAMAFTGYPMTDEKGRPVLDKDGDQVMAPPDLTLATAAANKVAPYIHQTLRPRERGEESTKLSDEERKAKIVSALANMGVALEQPEQVEDDQPPS